MIELIMAHKKIIGGFLLAAVLGAAGAYIYASKNPSTYFNPLADNSKKDNQEIAFVENPLTGVKVPVSEKDRVLGRRPLVVQVGNNVDARPPSNVSQADMVYEVVAEGGITRFMAIFLQNDPEKIGPVRSMRAYFLYWILELDAMVMHDGYSSSPILEVSAVDLIKKLNVRSLFIGGLYGFRDNSREAPNNEYISAKTAREWGDKLGWQGAHPIESWKFKEDSDKPYGAFSKASELDIVFWTTGDYDSRWVYDSEKNLYFKSTGGIPHKDLETGVQLSAKNVIVQFARETAVNDEKNHLLYANIGSGKAIIFLDGVAVPATWSKADAVSRTRFYDTNGQEIKFNRGVMWVAVVPDRSEDQVTYK